MDPIYDKSGRVCAYFDAENEQLVSPDGTLVGWTQTGSVFGLSTHQLGWFEDEQLWDAEGKAVAFLAQASGGPAKPPLSEPAGGGPDAPGGDRRDLADTLTHPGTLGGDWSSASWDVYLAG